MASKQPTPTVKPVQPVNAPVPSVKPDTQKTSPWAKYFLFTQTTTPTSGTSRTIEEKLKEATADLNNIQSSLDNDQIIEFIKLVKTVPSGIHPSSRDDVDKITKAIYDGIPKTWPPDLKTKTTESLNNIRKKFDLSVLNFSYLPLIIFILSLIILGLFIYFKQ
jgi:hypothetical protein